MSLSTPYKGYTINSAPYQTKEGGFTVNGRIDYFTKPPYKDDLYAQIFATEEADKAFIDYVKAYIDTI